MSIKNVAQAKQQQLRKQRGITDIELSGIDPRDHPDYVDTHIAFARWEDTGEELTDTELEELNNDYDFVYRQIEKETQGRTYED